MQIERAALNDALAPQRHLQGANVMAQRQRSTDPNPSLPNISQAYIDLFESRIDRSPGQGPNGDCHQWQGRTTEGYGMISIDGREVLAHRLAYFLATGVWPSQCVLHRCDNPPCCNGTHLWMGTRGDNNRDAISKGRHAVGDEHPFRLNPELTRHGDTHPYAKMNEVLVLELRAIHATRRFSASQITAIAVQRCGQPICQGTVMKAITGKTWKYIKPKGDSC